MSSANWVPTHISPMQQPPDRTPRAATHAELADTIPPSWATQGEALYAHASQKRGMSPSARRNRSRPESVPGRSSVFPQEGSIRHNTRQRSASGRHSLVQGKSHDARVSDRPPGQDGVAGRPSVFHEGSMNDRVSDRPPASFTGDDTEAAMESYAQDGVEDVRTARGGPSWLKKPLPELPAPDLAASTSTTATTTNNRFSRSTIETNASEQESESAKRPGFFRIGKSLAAALSNPAGMWDDLTQRRRGQGREELPRMDLQLWEDRRQRAEQAYAAMKRDGRLPASKVTTTPAVKARGPQRTSEETKAKLQTAKKEKGREESEMQPLQTLDGNRLQVPSSTKEVVEISDTERDARHEHRSSLTFKKRSVPNLKKVKSDIHRLTSESLTALLPLPPPVPAEEVVDMPESARAIRQQVSRKDLNRQHKLSKRVSDLESKLESARRELDEVKGKSTPVTSPNAVSTTSVYNVPIRRGFVPGLSSLPSERILLREQEAKEQHDLEKKQAEVHEMDVDPVVQPRTGDLKKDPRRTQRMMEGRTTEEPRKKSTGKRKSAGQGTDTAVDEKSASDTHQSGSKRRRSNKGHSQTLPAPELPQDGIYELEGSTVTLTATVLRRPSEKVLEPRPRMVPSIAENTLLTTTTSTGDNTHPQHQQQQSKWNLRPRRSSLAASRYPNHQSGSTGTVASIEKNTAQSSKDVNPEVSFQATSASLAGAGIPPTAIFNNNNNNNNNHQSINPSLMTGDTSQDMKNGVSTSDLTKATGNEMDTTESHHPHNGAGLPVVLALDAVEEVEEEEELAEKRRKRSLENIQQQQKKMKMGKTKTKMVQEFEWPDDVF